MKRKTVGFLFVLGCVSLSGTLESNVPNNEDKQVRQVIQDYVQGWREADKQQLSRVFALENGHLIWISGERGSEQVQSMSFEDIVARDKRPNPEYGRHTEILSLDIVDDKLAIAKVEISYSKGSYIDYLVLYKVGDDWRIVTKTFVTRPASVPTR